jgi:small conductance mechanosensitive channel
VIRSHRRPLSIAAALVAIVLTGAVSPARAQPSAEPEPAATAPAQAQESEPEPDRLLLEANELEASLEELQTKIDRLKRDVRRTGGDEERVFEERLWRSQLRSVQLLRELVDNVLAREARGDEVAEEKRFLARELKDLEQRIPQHLAWRKERLRKLREARREASGAESVALDTQISDQEGKLQSSYAALIELADTFERVELDASALREFTAGEVSERAERLADWIRVTRQELAALAKRLRATPDDPELLAQKGQLEARLDRVTDRLSATTALLARLDVPASEYQQLLIQTTGEITADILDRDVLLGLVASWREQVKDTLTTRGASWVVKALVFALILAAFRILASVVRRMTTRALRSEKANVSQLLRDTLIAWSSRVVMAIGFLVALSQLGVQIGPLLAGLGIAGFIVGFALQDSLANFAAGAMILVYRPFDVGDVIEAATVSGKVSAMSLVSTTIHTFDNQTLIVPNNRIWGDVIRNVTAQRIRRVDLVVGVGYAEDVEHVERILHDVIAKHPKTLDDPEPMVKLHKLGESGVDFVVRPWARTQDYWEVYWDLTREVKLRFDREGIRIPYPQRDVHVRSTPPDEA